MVEVCRWRWCCAGGLPGWFGHFRSGDAGKSTGKRVKVQEAAKRSSWDLDGVLFLVVPREGCEDAVIAGQVSPGSGYQRRQTRHEVLGAEQDVRGAITERVLE